MPQRHEDGNFDIPAAITPVSISYPFRDKGDAQTRMVTQTFRVRAASVRRPFLGQEYPDRTQIERHRSLKLIDQSEPTDAGGGIVDYTRTWADCPRKRKEYEQFPYSYQFVVGEDDEREIIEYAKTVTSVIAVSYIETENPATIKTKLAFRYLKFGNEIVTMGVRDIKWGSMVLGEDTQIQQWRGNFWEVRERYVPALGLGGGTTITYIHS
jgi:hypothetical protein